MLNSVFNQAKEKQSPYMQNAQKILLHSEYSNLASMEGNPKKKKAKKESSQNSSRSRKSNSIGYGTKLKGHRRVLLNLKSSGSKLYGPHVARLNGYS